MKQEYVQQFHSRTSNGWKLGPFEARVRLHPEDAAAVNRRFAETGVKCTPVRAEKQLRSANPINIYS